jgi:predicted transcriptional regulator
LLVGNNGSVVVFNGNTTTDMVTGVNASLTQIAWRPDGSYALIIGDKGTVLRFSNSKERIKIINSGTLANLHSLAWRPDGSIAIIAGESGVMLKFDHSTQRIFKIQTSVDTGFNKVTWSDGQHAEVQGENGTVVVYSDDKTPQPTVSILEPAEGSTVSGGISFNGLAAVEKDSLSKLEVRIDSGPWQDAFGTIGWAFSIDSRQLSNGPHMLYVRAWTSQGISIQRSVSIIVENIFLPPSLEIASPGEGELSGIITIAGTASGHTSPVERVDVRMDDYGWEAAAGIDSWMMTWDTTTLADGPHSFKVRAWDGEQYTVISREIIVKNAPAKSQEPSNPATPPSEPSREPATVQNRPHVEPVISIDNGQRTALPAPQPSTPPLTPSVPAAKGKADGLTIVVQWTPLWTLIFVGLAFSTENGKYALFQMLYVPLYSRIKKDRVLDNFTRGMIYGFIMSHPGVHYNFIKQKLGLNNGSIVYHLTVLERQELIKSERVGLFKRFYPIGKTFADTELMELNETQEKLLELLRDHPGLTQRELADMTGISARVINYHVGLLQRARLVRLERIGKITKCFATERMPVC